MWGTPHKDDLSRCSSYPEFVEKLNYIVQKLFMALRRRPACILVGDIRTKGSFYSMQHDLMRVGQMEAFIVKGQYNCVSDTRSYKKPFIPVVTEYLLLSINRMHSFSLSRCAGRPPWIYGRRTSLA